MEPIESVACPVCGGELLPHILCPFCGTDITLKSLEGLEPTYKCPVCGKEAQTKFICNECGSEFRYELITEKMGAVEPIKKEEKKPVAKKSAPKAESLVELKGGLTNGLTASSKREKGLTNGLTNGVSKKEKGLTNGLKGGMVNGTGVTNGTKPAKKPAKKAREGSKISVVAVAVVVLLLIFGAFYIFMMPHKEGMEIDGDFSDWKDVTIKEEFRTAVNPLDMVRYATKLSDGGLFIYLEGREGTRLFDTSGSRIYAFVDADNNPSTGYRINGIGADYLCKIYGEGGRIDAKSAYEYAGPADGSVWSWNSPYVLFVAYSGNRLEMSFFPESISENYRVAFYTSDAFGNYEVSSVNIAEDMPSVYVGTKSVARDVYTEQGASVHLMDIDIFATGGDLTLQSILLTASGFQRISLRDVTGNEIGVVSGNQITVGRNIPDGGRLQYQLWATLPATWDNGTLVYAEISQIMTASPAIVSLKAEPVRAYLGMPSEIKIDGAFGDWQSASDDPDEGLPEHIEIREYSAAEDPENLYFYLKVDGGMMAGVLVPEKYAEGMPNPNITAIPPTETGEDVLRIFIDTDSGRYYIEILGKGGEITSSALYHWNGYVWVEIPSASIETGKDSTRMEGGISMNILGNPSTISVRFEMSDWEDNRDTTGSVSPAEVQSQGTRYAEISPSPVPEFQEVLLPILFTIGLATIIHRKRK